MNLDLFGGKIEIELFELQKQKANKIIETGYNEGLRLQKIFNLFDEKSELSILNKKRELVVSDELKEVLSEAIKISKLSKGEYDISLGKNFLERKQKKRESPLYCSYKNIKLKGNKVSLTHPDVLIDLGSIAKGYITDKIVEVLKKEGAKSGFIDSRGDLRLFGNEETKIHIAHPRKKGEKIYEFTVKNASVATSGDYNQFFGSYKKSHLINKKDLSSVTVIARTLTEADAYATLISVSKKENYEKILKKKKKIRVITIDEKLNIKEYNTKWNKEK